MEGSDMKSMLKKIGKIIGMAFLVVWLLNQCFPYQMSRSYQAKIAEQIKTQSSTNRIDLSKKGYMEANGMYHSDLTEQNTCATNLYPIGTKVSIWCGKDIDNGCEIQATVVSNETILQTSNIIEFSKDINDFFAGDNSIYTVWVKEV